VALGGAAYLVLLNVTGVILGGKGVHTGCFHFVSLNDDGEGAWRMGMDKAVPEGVVEQLRRPCHPRSGAWS